MVMKVIPGYPTYVVSQDGEVLRYLKWGLYKKAPTKTYQGYTHVKILKGKRIYKETGAHRLVLMAWDRLPIGDEQADHIDHDRSNNSLANLGGNSGV